MPDGGTLLLGGLKFYEQQTHESGMPVLVADPRSSGFLFSRKGHYVNRRNLIVLITAEIVPLEEREPKGEWKAPVPLETFVPLEDPCVEDFAPTCAPPALRTPAVRAAACSPCGRR